MSNGARAHQRVCSRKPMGSRNQPRKKRESHLGCTSQHTQYKPIVNYSQQDVVLNSP